MLNGFQLTLDIVGRYLGTVAEVLLHNDKVAYPINQNTIVLFDSATK